MHMKNGQNIIPLLNNKLPLISIIVLTYKNQKFLKDTISSILNQDYPEIELILSDDSSDVLNVEDINKFIEKNRKENLKRYLIRVNEENLGTVKHANKVLKFANGFYIKFVACGDKFYSNSSLKSLYEFACRQNSLVTSSLVDICSEDFSRSYYIHPNKYRSKIIEKYQPNELFKVLCLNNIIPAVSVLFQRNFFSNIEFDERYKLLEDWPLWLKISRNGIKIEHLNLVTMFYADGGISALNSNAFKAPSLCDDLLKCYKLEILPYIDDFSFFAKHYIKYKSLSLKEEKNIDYYIKYSIYILFDNIKHYIKKILKFKGINND